METKDEKAASILVLAFLAALPAQGQRVEKRIYTAYHINPHPPAIDGKPDDPVWQKGTWEGGFIQRIPYEGREPSEKTLFKILSRDRVRFLCQRRSGWPDAQTVFARPYSH